MGLIPTKEEIRFAKLAHPELSTFEILLAHALNIGCWLFLQILKFLFGCIVLNYIFNKLDFHWHPFF
jgi:hypothetical protein